MESVKNFAVKAAIYTATAWNWMWQEPKNYVQEDAVM